MKKTIYLERVKARYVAVNERQEVVGVSQEGE